MAHRLANIYFLNFATASCFIGFQSDLDIDLEDELEQCGAGDNVRCDQALFSLLTASHYILGGFD